MMKANHQIAPPPLWLQLLGGLRLCVRPARVAISLLAMLLIALIVKIPDLWLAKDDSFANALSERSHLAFAFLADSIRSFSPAEALDALYSLFVALPVSLAHDYPWTVTLVAIPVLVLWTIAGGAVSRSAAEEFSHATRMKATASLAFALSRPWSLLLSVLTPFLVAAILALALAVAGYVLFRIPVVNVVGGVLYAFMLIGGGALLLVLFACSVGQLLFVPAVVCEGVDAIDALQRVFAYVLGRPARTILYLLLLAVQGVLLALILAVVVSTVSHLTANLTTQWLPDSTASALHSAATTRHAELPAEGAPTGLAAAVRAVAFWSAFPGLIAGAILISFYFCGSSVLYLVLRRVCDGQDTGDLWFPGMIAGTVAPISAPASPSEADEDEDSES